MGLKKDFTPEHSEAALLGAMFLDGKARKVGLATVRESDFTDPKRRAVFIAIQKLAAEGKAVDMATVAEELGDSVEPLYLTELENAVPTTAHAEAYAERVRATGIFREFRSLCENTAQGGNGKDVAAALDAHAVEVRRLIDEATGARHERFDLGAAFGRACDLLEEQVKSRMRFPFGVPVLDEVFAGGALPGEVIVTGGFPGSGKTSLALWVMQTNLALGHRVLFLSYEMREAALIHRFFSQQLGISSGRLRGGNGRLPPKDWQRIVSFCNDNINRPLVILDDVSLRLSGIEAAVETYQPQLVCLDYLQLVRGESKRQLRRYEAVEQIMHGLAALAHRTGVGIILLSQLRKPETDSEPMPHLHLLKDSSSIEQTASGVILIRLTRNEINEPQFYLAVAKNRNGPLLDWTPVYFDAAVFRFGATGQEMR